MKGKRVLVSGMGGELGSRVASLLEKEPWVASLEGIDVDPPRRRLHRAVFHRIVPGDHDRTVETVSRCNPHLVIHIAVWEPAARARPTTARHLTDEAVNSVLGAAAECSALETIIVRSGIEIYGRDPNTLTRPNENAPINPTSAYGHTVADIERVAATIGERVGARIGALRLATVLGPHVPSTLGRVLRLPVVPYNAFADPPFGVIHQNDAARAFVAAARAELDRPVNVIAPGSITASQAVRRGRRLPIPVTGPQWLFARTITHLAGAPIPDHIAEMLRRGRLADNRLAAELLGFTPEFSTTDVIDQLYTWPDVVRSTAHETAA